MIATENTFTLGSGLRTEGLRAMLGRISPGRREGTLLTLAARTSATLTTLNVAGFSKLLLWGRVTAASGTAGLQFSVRYGANFLGGNSVFLAPSIQNAVVTSLGWWCVFGPDLVRTTGGTFGGIGQGDSVPILLPSSILAGVAHNDGSSYTYEVGYILA